MEEDLFKAQDDLDRQKLKLAERIGKFAGRETEFYKKQDKQFFNSHEFTILLNL